MNKVEIPAQPNTDLTRVDPQAGKLRRLLFMISIFILWTALALIASLAKPIGLLPLFSSHGAQNTLASGLVDELFGSFFSLYTLLYLSLFLLTVYISYALIRTIIAKALIMDDPGPVGVFLKHCAFNQPACPEIDTQERNVEKTSAYGILTTLGGPAYLTIDGGDLAFVAAQDSDVEILTPGGVEPETFFIEHGTVLKCLLHCKEKQIMVTVHTRLNDGQPVEFHGIRITYSLNYANLERNDEGSAELRSQIAAFAQDPNWEALIEDLIQSEFSALVSEYSGTDILNIMGHKSTQSSQDEAGAIRPSDKTHNIRKHGRHLNLSQKPPVQLNGGTILRNRRRSIQPEMRADESEPIEEKMVSEPKQNTVEALSQRLSRSVNALFSKQMININIEEIGKVSFNGIH